MTREERFELILWRLLSWDKRNQTLDPSEDTPYRELDEIICQARDAVTSHFPEHPAPAL